MKDDLYHDWFLMDMFILLVVEVFKNLHQQVDKFFHQCANMAWGAKSIKSPPLSILHAFYKQKVLVMIQHTCALFILKHAIVVYEGLSRLSILLRGPPFLYLICFLWLKGVFKTWCSPCGLPFSVVHLSSWMRVLPFYFLYSPFSKVLWFFMIGKVSSFWLL
jgi:hypothetical protein